MQETIADAPAQTAHDFAGLLVALTAAKPTELPKWNDQELPQDVVTLSYERALRTHARYKAAAEIDTPHMRDSQALRPNIAAQREMRAHCRNEAPQETSSPVFPMSGHDRKCASVTIRMSKAECEQLHARAAEAGLTISAYLRSCTFEAETLRAQVKETLADLRSAHAAEVNPGPEAGIRVSRPDDRNSTRGSRLGWFRRIVPDLHPARNLIRA